MDFLQLASPSRTLRSASLTALAALLLAAPAQAAVVILDNFEVNEGHFTSDPNTGSGTSVGFVKTTAATNANRVTTDFFTGSASQQIVLTDDPAVAGNATSAWLVRHLSGGGTPANNIVIGSAAAGDSWVGFFLKTSIGGFDASLMIDDGAALERASFIPVIPDGQWHLYQWKLQDPASWEAFAGTAPDGDIDAASVTVDSLFFRANTTNTTDANFFIDDVSYSDVGGIPVPEPSVLGSIGLSALLLGRRRRAGGAA